MNSTVMRAATGFLVLIAIDDVVGVIDHALTAESLHGPVNTVAPRAVTNSEFTKTLGRVLGRPTLLPMPAFMTRAILGEMADELLLASTRVEPRMLLASGYHFLYGELESALRHLLEKDASAHSQAERLRKSVQEMA
jgi:uncharacterized protein